jgi:hypothetical protein
MARVAGRIADRRVLRLMRRHLSPANPETFRCECRQPLPCRRIICTPMISSSRNRLRFIRPSPTQGCGLYLCLKEFSGLRSARCGTLYPIHKVVIKVRRDLRNVRDAMARKSQSWNSLSLIGHVELDAVEQADICLLPPPRRGLIQTLPSIGGMPDSMIWVLHAHVCIHHPCVPREYIRHALALQWGCLNQIDVRDFYPDCEADESAANRIGYAQKSRHSTEFLGKWVADWPVSWSAQFWSSFETAGGFRCFRSFLESGHPEWNGC